MLKIILSIAVLLITIPLIIFSIKSFSTSQKQFQKEWNKEKKIIVIDKNSTAPKKVEIKKEDKFDKEWENFDKEWKNF